jgi:hypothetical protein
MTIRGDIGALFTRGLLSEQLDSRLRGIKGFVYRIPEDQFLSTSTDTLIEHVEGELRLLPLELHEDRMRMDQSDVEIDVTDRFDYNPTRRERNVRTGGYRLTFLIPFSGTRDLWGLKPNVWSSAYPKGEVDPSASVVSISIVNTRNAEPERFKQDFDRELALIRTMVSGQRAQIDEFHRNIPDKVQEAAAQRRADIEHLRGLLSSFDIPLVKKDGMPDFRPIQMTRRQQRPLPKPPAGGYKREYGITVDVYDELLGIIRHTGASFEGAPQTYLPLGEEGLRDNMLSHINVTFKGKATGETFRRVGKTDIRLEEESRAAFVAECKLWGGEQVLLRALAQLLSYLTWRDCKAALILFNKAVAGFAGVQQTIPTALQSHPLYLRAHAVPFPGEWRFDFKSSQDEGREVTVHVFAFNLYVEPECAGKKR